MTTELRECQCTMAQSLTGDGCRYCQPQTYIEYLHDQIDDGRQENDDLLGELVGALTEGFEALKYMQRSMMKITEQIKGTGLHLSDPDIVPTIGLTLSEIEATLAKASAVRGK